MKRLLLIGCLFAAFACTKEPAELSDGSGPNPPRIVGTPTSELALKGEISIKLTPEMAQAVAVAQAQLPATRSGAVTRSGVGTIDELLNEIGAGRFERIVAYNPDWEEIYDETGMNRWYSVSFDESVDLGQIGSRFAALSGVAVVEYQINPRYIRPMSVGPAIPASGDNLCKMGGTRAAAAMNDPLLEYQWHYDNPGPNRHFDQPKAGADINLLDAWQLCTGSEDIIVAVIDEPVQTDHPDLKANIWSNPKNSQEHGFNFWDNSSVLDWKTPAKEEDGTESYADHGTHVAGVIAAVNNNGRGVCGIARRPEQSGRREDHVLSDHGEQRGGQNLQQERQGVRICLDQRCGYRPEQLGVSAGRTATAIRYLRSNSKRSGIRASGRCAMRSTRLSGARRPRIRIPRCRAGW